MPKLKVVDRAGIEHTIDAAEGRSVMEVIRDNGFDDLLALCGGCCSCATCHVYIDEESLRAVDVMSRDEDDLLDSSDHRTPASRLSCQISISSNTDGMRVTIAPED